ncbi:MAG: hypothetical protein M0R46_05805 [Candidatus Muirbacterium halophilum]|nr:hypothetical protein [Candidatus Muirbacterium halophilum]MCK9475411.1 hypothetical protein [Candidatus Muirbacterium halophilum]
MKSVINNIDCFVIDEIIKEEKISVIYQKMNENGKYYNKNIIINEKFKNKDFEIKIIIHELFHFFEEKFKKSSMKIISESAARIFEKYIYYKFS